MSTQYKITFSFSVMLFLLALIGGTAISNAVKLANLTEDMYEHPFVVSNAVRDISVNLLTMHRDMKDVILSVNEKELNAAIDAVNASEKQILSDLEGISVHFLGDKSMIEVASQAILAWRPIREEVIILMLAGNQAEAVLINKSKGAAQVLRINTATQALIQLANAQAEEFHDEALISEKTTLFLLSILLFFSMLMAVVIYFYVVRMFAKVNLELMSYKHLIDQNMMVKTVSPDGKTIDISSALCRYTGYLKEEVMRRKNNFFLAEDNHALATKIWRSIQTGHAWEGEYALRSADGQDKWVSAVIEPILDADYHPVAYRSIVLDISDRKEVEALTITDKLTSLYNRQYFEIAIKQQASLARRNKQHLTLAILDMDYFKKYNEKYGHEAGDSVLAEVAVFLKQALKRPSDYVFRMGGEEFGILMVGMNEQESLRFLETIRAGVEALNIDHELSYVSDYVTVSIGFRSYAGSDMPADEHLFIQADKALHSAKEHRNTVRGSVREESNESGIENVSTDI
ncbi:MAG: diguanylate cyclase [Methylococcaceae bacterium]|nr:diguanylate cyclase [Methylococcaceae bacterium]